MSSTNKTTNYNLSQFIGSDKPAWLVDYNGDMSAIDTQMKANADAAAAAQTTANTAYGKADTNASAISTLDSQINGASGVAADVVSLQGSVNTINSLIGNGEPTTTDKTIIGAINEMNSYVARVGSYVKGVHNVAVTADGVKTMGTLLDELYAAASSYIGALADDEYAVMHAIVAGSVHIPKNMTEFTNNSTFGTQAAIDFGGSASLLTLDVATIKASGSGRVKYEFDAGGLTITDESSVVPAAETSVRVYLIVYKNF